MERFSRKDLEVIESYDDDESVIAEALDGTQYRITFWEWDRSLGDAR